MNADTAGTGGSGTAVTVDSTTGFDSAGTILWCVGCVWYFAVPIVAVPFVPLVIPKNCVELFDVYVINSLPTKIVPAESKPVVESTVTAVPDPPVPAVSAFNDPSNSVCATPVTVPP